MSAYLALKKRNRIVTMVDFHDQLRFAAKNAQAAQDTGNWRETRMWLSIAESIKAAREHRDCEAKEILAGATDLPT